MVKSKFMKALHSCILFKLSSLPYKLMQRDKEIKKFFILDMQNMQVMLNNLNILRNWKRKIYIKHIYIYNKSKQILKVPIENWKNNISFDWRSRIWLALKTNDVQWTMLYCLTLVILLVVQCLPTRANDFQTFSKTGRSLYTKQNQHRIWNLEWKLIICSMLRFWRYIRFFCDYLVTQRFIQ